LKAFVGITGASGTIYGLRIAQELLKRGLNVYLSVSKAGKIVAQEELGIKNSNFKAELLGRFFNPVQQPIYLEPDALNSPPASGSAGIDFCFIAPCSVSTLSHIACGTGQNLIHRAADVALKEGKKLVLLVRETPLSIIHLENMLKAAKAGALILPAAPAFYHHPKTIDDLVDFLVGKCLDVVGLANDLFPRYLK
jgi:4-hydroxy-3-polyprenylbenzoate decarboxylase